MLVSLTFRVEVCQKAENAHHDINPDILAQLSSLERHLVDSQLMLTVRGKRGSPVPVLIPDDCMPAMKYIWNASVREQLGVNGATDDWGNHFLFASTGKMIFIY